MSKIIIEYFPEKLSEKARKLIRTNISPSMTAHDDSSSQYAIDICKDICEEYELTKDVILINHLILNDVSYIEI